MPLSVGALAPPFSLKATIGRPRIVPQDGPVLIAFIAGGCPVSRLIAPVLALLESAAEASRYPFLIVAPDEPATLSGYAAKTKQKLEILADPSPFARFRVYKIAVTPTLMRLDKGRVIAIQEGWSLEEWQRQAQAVWGLNVPDLSHVEGIPANALGTPLAVMVKQKITSW